MYETSYELSKEVYAEKIERAKKEIKKTKEEWEKDYRSTFPFVGKRWFNFMGGNGTGMSIIINPNGDTLIESHGRVSSSVEDKGKFKNPMQSEDGSGYLIKGNQIFLLENGNPVMD